MAIHSPYKSTCLSIFYFYFQRKNDLFPWAHMIMDLLYLVCNCDSLIQSQSHFRQFGIHYPCVLSVLSLCWFGVKTWFRLRGSALRKEHPLHFLYLRPQFVIFIFEICTPSRGLGVAFSDSSNTLY